MRLLRRAPRKGVALLLIVILICSTAMVGMLTYMGTVAVGAARVHHQRDTVQAVYAAESGIEIAIAQANTGNVPSGSLTGTVGGAFYTTTVARDGAQLTITSDGLQQRPGRTDLIRRVEVRCHRHNGTWHSAMWRTLPPPEISTVHPADIGPEVEGS